MIGDYGKASAWLASLVDPATGAPYKPLTLDPAWWRLEFRGGRFVPRTGWASVVRNVEWGHHSYAEVCELVAQSNATLQPVLVYKPHLLT